MCVCACAYVHVCMSVHASDMLWIRLSRFPLSWGGGGHVTNFGIGRQVCVCVCGVCFETSVSYVYCRTAMIFSLEVGCEVQLGTKVWMRRLFSDIAVGMNFPANS